MGGRASGGGGAGGRGGGSADFNEAKRKELSDLMDFEAAPFLSVGATNEQIGYEMHVHKQLTGRSLIADTNSDISSLKTALRENAQMGKAYGLSSDTVRGIASGIREKISVREQAIKKMEGARSEYERYSREARIGAAKSNKRGGKWM